MNFNRKEGSLTAVKLTKLFTVIRQINYFSVPFKGRIKVYLIDPDYIKRKW